jgi:hypothetical protein
MLPVRPSIFIGESLTSYLYRLARANFFPDVYKLFDTFSIVYKNIVRNNYSLETINKISTKTKHSLSTLLSMSFYNLQENFEHKIKRIYMLDNVQYCPMCINKNTYLKKVWLYKPLNICLEHNIPLVRMCWKCQKEINLAYFFEGRCPVCLSLYKKVPFNAFDNPQLLNSQRELFCIFSTEKYKSSIGSFTFEQFLNLVHRSCYLLDTSKTYFQDSTRESSDNLQSNSFMNVLWMYKIFPDNFEKILNEFSKTKKYYNRFEFEMLFADESFKDIQEAYYGFWIKQIAKGNIRKPPAFLLTSSYYMDHDVLLNKSEYPGLNEHKIESLINRLNNRKQLITRSEAAFLLGINRLLVKNLIQMRIFTLTVVGKREMLHYHEISQLHLTLRGEMTEDLSDKIRMRHAINTYASKGLSILKIIIWIVSGRLKPYHLEAESHMMESVYLISELLECLDYHSRVALDRP